MIRSFIFFFTFGLSFTVFAQRSSQVKILDSIQTLRDLSADEQYEGSERIAYAELATKLSAQIDNDTTLLKRNKNLAFQYLNNRNLNLYRVYSRKNKTFQKKRSTTNDFRPSRIPCSFPGTSVDKSGCKLDMHDITYVNKLV